MRLPFSEHKEPVRGRLHQRRQLQNYPHPYYEADYRVVMEPMPRTPDEIDDAISRSVPLSPATPRLRVALPSPTHPMLIPTSTSVTSTLIVSTLTASSIIPLTPDPSGTTVVENPHPPVMAAKEKKDLVHR